MRTNRQRSRSRSRSRSPDNKHTHHNKHRNHHNHNHNTDRNRDRDQYRNKTNRDKFHKQSEESKLRNRNRLIAARSASVVRNQSVLRSNSILRSIAKPSILSSNTTSKNTDDGPTKPKFLTRKQREEIALRKLNEKRLLERDRQKQIESQREKFFNHNKNNSRNNNDIIMNDRRNNKYKRNHNNKKALEISRREQRELSELQLIKDQYLGKKREKKSIVPPSQKFKFNFDWEISEDTSEDLNQLYSRRAKVGFLFGRGYIAGIDRDEQRKKNEIIWRDINNKKKKKHFNKSENNDTDNNASEYVNKKLRLRRLEREKKIIRKLRKDELDARNWRDKSLSEMTERDWRILKEEFRISTKFGGRLPNPVRFWNESSLPTSILTAIRDVAGYKEPYKIQRMAIPVGLSNRDCVGIAETGSGKTAAFVLPMLVYVLRQPPMNNLNFEDGPYALVLAPTRELAKQIESETNKFATYCSISAITIVGGINHDTQSNLLRNGVEVIIATPGRLLDCIDRRILVLNQCNYIVLDEADRMIDMG
eukprot:249254_1